MTLASDWRVMSGPYLITRHKGLIPSATREHSFVGILPLHSPNLCKAIGEGSGSGHLSTTFATSLDCSFSLQRLGIGEMIVTQPEEMNSMLNKDEIKLVHDPGVKLEEKALQ